jgi:hypothetical protein
MKKTLSILSICALLATSAFAEISYWGWSRGVFTPASIDQDGSVEADFDTSWGDESTYVEFGFTGATEDKNAGFNLTFANKTAFVDDDEAYTGLGYFDVEEASVWAIPLEGLKAGMGLYSYVDWYESESFGGRDFARNLLGKCNTKAYTFDEVYNTVNSWVSYSNSGFMAAAQVGIDDADSIDTVDLFAFGDYFVGYTIENVGTVKVAFFGDASEDSRYAQAQFSLATIENLQLKLSGAVPVSADDADYTAKIDLAGDYSMDAATIHYYALETVADANILELGLGLDYSVTDSVTSTNDIRGYITDGDNTVAGTIGVKKAFGDSYAGAAIQGNYNLDSNDYEFGIPLMITISL